MDKTHIEHQKLSAETKSKRLAQQMQATTFLQYSCDVFVL